MDYLLLLQSFGKSPSYLRLQSVEAESDKKQVVTEIDRSKSEGRYITEDERLALLEVTFPFFVQML